MADESPSEAEDRIVLVGAEKSYWLLSGEEYLNAMLSAEAYFPTPVIYYEYDSVFELNMGLEEGVLLSSLWAIHPGIIGRLKREDDIEVVRK